MRSIISQKCKLLASRALRGDCLEAPIPPFSCGLLPRWVVYLPHKIEFHFQSPQPGESNRNCTLNATRATLHGSNNSKCNCNKCNSNSNSNNLLLGVRCAALCNKSQKAPLSVISAGKKRSNNIIKYRTMNIARRKSKESMTGQWEYTEIQVRVIIRAESNGT